MVCPLKHNLWSGIVDVPLPVLLLPALDIPIHNLSALSQQGRWGVSGLDELVLRLFSSEKKSS